MHEDPQLPNFSKANNELKLKAGMTLAKEPMIKIGAFRVTAKPDNGRLYLRCKLFGSFYKHYCYWGEWSGNLNQEKMVRGNISLRLRRFKSYFR